jgi:hypothetical protein
MVMEAIETWRSDHDSPGVPIRRANAASCAPE